MSLPLAKFSKTQDDSHNRLKILNVKFQNIDHLKESSCKILNENENYRIIENVVHILNLVSAFPITSRNNKKKKNKHVKLE